MSKIFFLTSPTQLWPILAYIRASSKGHVGIQQACLHVASWGQTTDYLWSDRVERDKEART